ncbi:hypothetical protein OAG36_00565 [bacterium]|nr:hypothetical protein [bacterium]
MEILVEKAVQYGLPTVLLSVLVIGIWRGSKHIAYWIKPIIENIANKHLELVDTLKINSEETKDALTNINSHMKAQTVTLEKLGNKMDVCPYRQPGTFKREE